MGKRSKLLPVPSEVAYVGFVDLLEHEDAATEAMQPWRYTVAPVIALSCTPLTQDGGVDLIRALTVTGRWLEVAPGIGKVIAFGPTASIALQRLTTSTAVERVTRWLDRHSDETLSDGARPAMADEHDQQVWPGTVALWLDLFAESASEPDETDETDEPRRVEPDTALIEAREEEMIR